MYHEKCGPGVGFAKNENENAMDSGDGFARFESVGGSWKLLAFYRLKRTKYLVCNTDATLKIIAVAKVRANIAVHICSSIAWQAGAQSRSQPPAPGKSSPRWTGP